MANMFKIQSVWTGVAGTPWVNTMYFDAVGAGTAQQAANAVRVFWDAIKATITSKVTMQIDADVPTVDSATGIAVGFSTVVTTPVAGTQGNPPLPFMTQANIQLRTNAVIAGRRLLGHIYVPGLTNSQEDANGQVNSATQVILNNAAGVLLSGATWQLEVWSRKNLQLSPAVAVNTTANFAVLRSRRD